MRVAPHHPPPTSHQEAEITQKKIFVPFLLQVCVPGCTEEKAPAERESVAAAAAALSLGEGERAPQQRPPRRSAGNYDNNMFLPKLCSDFFSEHLPFLKSPPDSI